MISTPPQIPNYAQGFARYRGESAHPELWEGLVGAYVPFLGPTGATLRDWSGWANDGVLENMSAAADWVPGEKGWALRFTAGKAGVAASPAKVDQAAGTVVLNYCRRGAAASYSGLFNVETVANNSPHEMILFDQVGDLEFYPNYDQTPSRYWDFGFAPNDLTLGRWYNVAVTWGDQQIRGYIDGVLQGSEAGSGGWSVSGWTAELLHIGRVLHTTLDLQCAGDIGAFYLFDRPLPANRLRRLHEDIHAPLRPRRPVLGMLPATGGPYGVTVGQMFHTGAVTGETFSTGTIIGECDGRSG